MKYLDLRFDLTRGGLNENEKKLGPVFCLVQVCHMALNSKQLKRDELRLHAKLQDKLDAQAILPLLEGTEYPLLELSDDEFRYLEAAIEQHRFHSASARLGSVLLDVMENAVKEKPAPAILSKTLVAPKDEPKS